MIWFKLREIPSQSAEMQISENGHEGLKMLENEREGGVMHAMV